MIWFFFAFRFCAYLKIKKCSLFAKIEFISISVTIPDAPDAEAEEVDLGGANTNKNVAVVIANNRCALDAVADRLRRRSTEEEDTAASSAVSVVMTVTAGLQGDAAALGRR